MKANISIFNNKTTKLDKSFDFNSTAEIGEIQPCLCDLTIPGSKYSINTNTLCQLAPLLSPTFARMSLRRFTSFVDMREIYHHFDELLTGRKVTHGNISTIVTETPTVPYRFLVENVLKRSVCSVYRQKTLGNSGKFYIALPSNLVDPKSCPFSFYTDSYYFEALNSTSQPGFLNHDYFNNRVFLCNQAYVDGSNMSFAYETRLVHSDLTNDANSYFTNSFGNMPTINDADFVIYADRADIPQIACYRLNKRGRMLRKVLLGLGFNIDIQSLIFTSHPLYNKEFSILPLLAFYKAWFDLMYPTRSINFANTYAGQLITKFDSDSISGPLNLEDSSILTLLNGFFDDLCRMTYFYENDFYTSHLSSLSNDTDVPQSSFISPSDGSDTQVYLSNNLPPILNAGDNASSSVLKLLSAANNFVLGGTLIGKKVNDYLKQYGIVSHDDETHFISSDIMPIDTGMIMSSVENDQMFLGQKAGHGEGRSFNKKVEFTAKRPGFLISFFSVIPKSGFSQGIAPYWDISKKMDFYQQRYDGIGYELTPWHRYFASNSVSSYTAGKSSYSFPVSIGFTGRFNHYKYKTNISSGDFSRRATAPSISSYYLDKRFEENNIQQIEVNQGEPLVAGSVLVYNNAQVPAPVPSVRACNADVFNFNRIFVNRTDQTFYGSDYKLEFAPIDDHFIIQMVNDMAVFAPVRSISDSWGADDGLADNANVSGDIKQS